ncbi:MAG: DUF4982 domain-containing protein [Acidobacteria bacterium]|nr:DUF4982 domain-containing protein [Acidobacteriota bacterium]
MSISRRSLVKAGLATSASALSLSSLWAENGEIAAIHPTSRNAAKSTQTASSVADSQRERLLMDFGWKFHLGNAADSSKDFHFGSGKNPKAHTYSKSGQAGAVTTVAFDDSAWRTLDLPHDWAIELPFVHDPELTNTGSKPLGRRFPDTSIGWYRRTFEIPAADEGKRLQVEFEGIFRDATVFLNGQRLGENYSGFVPVTYDITDLVDYGGKNTLVVRVDATLQEGWFYEGAGIYRHVWLTKTSALHFVHDGIFVQSDVKGNACTLRVSAEVRNETAAEVVCSVHGGVRDTSGKSVAMLRSEATTLAPFSTTTVLLSGKLNSPRLWSLEDPHLYSFVAKIESGGRTFDEDEVRFGVRTIRFDPNEGFFLNGKPTKVLGTCNHQDHAGVGVALPDRINEYRVELLLGMGSNAYRTSHNPPTTALLDACDRLGMLVMDETRLFSSSEEGLDELRRFVRRDRNHPSVVIWSIANEEPLQATPVGTRMAATMKRLVQDLDPTRPVTAAMNKEKEWGEGISRIVDVQGFNYGDAAHMDEYHRTHPHQPLIGTETASTVSTRGIYANDPARGYVSAYDLNHPAWAALAEEWWPVYSNRKWLAGGFAWTGFDYRGETTPYDWPCIHSHFGIMDTCGFPKDIYFYYKTWWGKEPWLHLFPHWNWAGTEGQPIDVWCYSNQDAVELFLNGKSLGKQDVVREKHLAWKVPYAPGTLEARAYKGGKVVLTAKRETTGAPARLAITCDRGTIAADGQDVSMLTVRVLDGNEREVPTAGNPITFTVSGKGTLIGVGNGDPSCHESDKGPERSAFNGLCMGIVQSMRNGPGEMHITVSSAGLLSADLTVLCKPAKDIVGQRKSGILS